MTKPTTSERIQHEREYVAFLEKRLASENFRRNEPAEVVEATKAKLKKAKLLLRCLESGR